MGELGGMTDQANREAQMLPNSRALAKSIGAMHYFTGKPCYRGHIEKRLTSNGSCATCSMINCRANRQANPDHHKARSRRNYEANRERIAIRAKQWRKANADRLKAQEKAWREANKERERNKKQLWNLKNRDKKLAQARSWHERNPGKRAYYGSQRIAIKKQATPAWANDAFIAEFYFAANFLSMVTGEWYHVDHVVPLQGKTVCGLHCEANLQVIPRSENLRKQNRYWPDMP